MIFEMAFGEGLRMEVDWEICLEQEVAGVDLGDKRLNDRLRAVLMAFGKAPQLSIPAALGGRNEMEAGYRLFAHPEVTPEKILSQHFANTRKRIRKLPVSLLVQDTTDVELTRPKQQVKGTGPMSSNSEFGAFLHPLVAFHPAGVPLGVVWVKHWTRSKIDTESTPDEKHQKRKQTPIEDKESIRWIEGLRVARDVAEESPDTQCILVCDSESDIYEFFAEPRHTSHGRSLEILVRGCQPRATTTKGVSIEGAVRAADDYYCGRWGIEVFFKTLKSGCRIEERQFEYLHRELNAIAVYLIVEKKPLPEQAANPQPVHSNGSTAGRLCAAQIDRTRHPNPLDRNATNARPRQLLRHLRPQRATRSRRLSNLCGTKRAFAPGWYGTHRWC